MMCDFMDIQPLHFEGEITSTRQYPSSSSSSTSAGFIPTQRLSLSNHSRLVSVIVMISPQGQLPTSGEDMSAYFLTIAPSSRTTLKSFSGGSSSVWDNSSSEFSSRSRTSSFGAGGASWGEAEGLGGSGGCGGWGGSGGIGASTTDFGVSISRTFSSSLLSLPTTASGGAIGGGGGGISGAFVLAFFSFFLSFFSFLTLFSSFTPSSSSPSFTVSGTLTVGPGGGGASGVPSDFRRFFSSFLAFIFFLNSLTRAGYVALASFS
mmetsp:Transcript_16630/g.34329  ORF Transcript_16630/g.34329 Transcript_16630/m.34329 type:complete len:263 (+) Transcript_16630:629-1417(+)